MENKRKNVIILVSLIFLLLALNYNFLDSSLESFLFAGQAEKVFVERIIDGDTLVSDIGNVRLLGINTPERGEKGYSEAKNFLEDFILNETVTLKYVGKREDKYGRILAYVFFKGENLNIRIVKEGFGNYYFYSGKDVYSDPLLEAWDSCISKEINQCEKSEDVCGGCVKILEGRIVNDCPFSCNIEGWEIREEGRDKFVFEGILEKGEEREFDLDLANTGGGLFLRDGGGKLVLWEGY